VHDFLEQGAVMAETAVLVELLAVVGDEDHERVVESPVAREPIEQHAHVPVDETDFGVVQGQEPIHVRGVARILLARPC
jgi:hypothetical protein